MRGPSGRRQRKKEEKKREKREGEEGAEDGPDAVAPDVLVQLRVDAHVLCGHLLLHKLADGSNSPRGALLEAPAHSEREKKEEKGNNEWTQREREKEKETRKRKEGEKEARKENLRKREKRKKKGGESSWGDVHIVDTLVDVDGKHACYHLLLVLVTLGPVEGNDRGDTLA